MRLLLTLLIYFILQAMHAQEAWTLEACVAYAKKHNLQLSQSNLNVESDRETYRQSIRDLLPSISGSTGYGINYGRSVDPNDNSVVNTDFFSNSYSVGASVTLFRGFQQLNAIKASKFSYKAGLEDIAQEEFLLTFRVMEAFYNIQFFEGLVEIAKEQVEIARRNYTLVQREIALGLKAGADGYEAKSTLLTDELSLTQSQQSLDKAKLKLIQEMNLNASEIVIVDDISHEEASLTGLETDSIYQKSLGFMPMIAAQKLRVAVAKKNVAIARGSLYPSLNFSAGYGTGYYETNKNNLNEIIPFSEQFRDNASHSIRFSLSIPIFNSWASRSGIKQQKIALERAKTQLEIQQQELYQLIQELVQEYQALQVELEQSTQKTEAQKLTYAIAQRKYDKGLISAVDLLQAKNDLGNAQNENLQVKLKAKINRKTIAFYRGVPLYTNDSNN